MKRWSNWSSQKYSSIWRLLKRERYWEQRARANWLRNEDRNTGFFQRMDFQRRKINYVGQLEDEEGRMSAGNEEMQQIACRYFTDLVTSRGRGDNTRLLMGILVHVSDGMDDFLCSRFTEEKIGAAMWRMYPTKAPREDGMPTLFYQQFWHIISLEVSS